jgi:hypothetical protein
MHESWARISNHFSKYDENQHGDRPKDKGMPPLLWFTLRSMSLGQSARYLAQAVRLINRATHASYSSGFIGR